MGGKQSIVKGDKIEGYLDYLTLLHTLTEYSYYHNINLKVDMIRKIWEENPKPEQWLTVTSIVDKTLLQLLDKKEVDLINDLLKCNLPLSDKFISKLIYNDTKHNLRNIVFTPTQCYRIAKFIYEKKAHKAGTWLDKPLKRIYATGLTELPIDDVTTVRFLPECDPITFEEITAPFYKCDNPIRSHCYNLETYHRYVDIHGANAIYCPVCKEVMCMQLFKFPS